MGENIYNIFSMILQVIFVTITVFVIVGTLVIGLLIYKARKDKIIKAGTPSLLYLILAGSIMLYTEIIITILPANTITCMASPWIRHIGFAITYSAIVMKTWRISIIMRIYKTKLTHTKDSHLFRAITAVTIVSGVYLIIWTITDPAQLTHISPGCIETQFNHTRPTSEDVCLKPWWDFGITLGELAFLIWGGVSCYRARKAPDVFNETQPISYALWNEALWLVFYSYASFLLRRQPDIMMASLLCFLRTLFTVTVTLLLLFVPKLRSVYGGVRELRGTVLDVYGARRIHRLSLMLDKGGGIKTIYCVPCGPLTYIEGQEEEGEEDSSSETDDNKEIHYTKAEVDNLIEMVTKLKSEKQLYKTQVKRLYQLLKEYKHKSLAGLPVYVVAETPEEECGFPNGINTQFIDEFDFKGGTASDMQFNNLSVPHCFPRSTSDQSFIVSQSRKASTVITCLSSTPDNTSIDGDELPHLMDQCVPYTGQSGTNSSPNHLISSVNLNSPDTYVPKISDSYLHIHSRSEASSNKPTSDLHEIMASGTTSESDDEYPKLLSSHVNNNGSTDDHDFSSIMCGQYLNEKYQCNGGSIPMKDIQDKLLGHEMTNLQFGTNNQLQNDAKKTNEPLKQEVKADSVTMYI